MAAILHEKRGDRPTGEAGYTRRSWQATPVPASRPTTSPGSTRTKDGSTTRCGWREIAQEQLKRRPEGDDTLGWVQLRRGVTADAIASFTRAVGRSPNNPVYHYHLGLAYLKMGDKARGRDELQRALTLSPDFSGARTHDSNFRRRAPCKGDLPVLTRASHS